MPYFVEGGFANMVGFAHPERMPCIDYRVSVGEQPGTVQMEMSARTDAASANCGAVFKGYHAVIVADPESGRILRSERTIDSTQAMQRAEAFFASVEYGPQQLGGRTFWLPRKLSAHDDKDEGRMYVTYSNCHRFGSEVRILPGATEAAPEAKPQ